MGLQGQYIEVFSAECEEPHLASFELEAAQHFLGQRPPARSSSASTCDTCEAHRKAHSYPHPTIPHLASIQERPQLRDSYLLTPRAQFIYRLYM